MTPDPATPSTTTSRQLALASVLLAFGVGSAVGVGGLTFAYAEGWAYMTDDPAACANCHVMQEQLDGWSRSSHHAVAVCNDCHTPEDKLGMLVTKARNGWHHSVAFTAQNFHEPIQITDYNLAITEQRCRSCHASVVDAIDGAHGEDAMSCTRCHDSVGHLH